MSAEAGRWWTIARIERARRYAPDRDFPGAVVVDMFDNDERPRW